MFQKLLVPLDGTPYAAAALPLARGLAREIGAEIVLVRVVPTGRAKEAEVAAAAEYLDGIAAELRADALRVQTAVSRGEVKLALVGDVGLFGADLVVMATHGRAGAARVVLGSVAEHLLTHTPVPMLVLTPGSRRVTHLRTLLVPVDGTPGSAAALTTAQALAGSMGSRIVLVEVVTPAAPFLATAELLPLWEAETRSRASAYVAGLARALVHTGVDAEGEAVMGLPGPMIVSTAERVEADLIVMSTRALAGLARAWLGSTADEVVRTARRPVLLVHQPAEAPPGREKASRQGKATRSSRP